MTMMNTSEQRITSLIEESERLYPLIDQKVNDEQRAVRMLRVGMQVVARYIEIDPAIAGRNLISYLNQELSPSPQAVFAPALPWDDQIDQLTILYGKVERGTLAADGTAETDASHVVHLTALALVYAAEYYPNLDQSKIAIYCWIHDIVEAYAGDVPSLGMTAEQEAKKHRDEQVALGRITQEFCTDYPNLVKFIENYENLIDTEARFVKSFDKLDPGFTHFANQGLSLRRHHGITSPTRLTHVHNETTARMSRYASEFPLILEDRQELLNRIIAVTDWNAPTSHKPITAQ